MTELLDNIFAIEVPESAKKFVIKNGVYTRWLWVDGERHQVLNLKTRLKILFVTKDCKEEQAASIVEQQQGGGLFRDYSTMGSYAKHGTYFLYTATESLQSLLKSKGLTAGNYLIIKKVEG